MHLSELLKLLGALPTVSLVIVLPLGDQALTASVGLKQFLSDFVSLLFALLCSLQLDCLHLLPALLHEGVQLCTLFLFVLLVVNQVHTCLVLVFFEELVLGLYILHVV